MKHRSAAMAWMMSGCILGMSLSSGEAVKAEVRPCLGATSVGGIDFNDCQAMSFGNPLADVEPFKLRMARKFSVVVARYYTSVALAHAPQTVNGLIAVRYNPRQIQIATSTVSIQCSETFSAARQLGCDTIAQLSNSRIASR